MNKVIVMLAEKLEQLRSAFWHLHTPHRKIDEVAELQPILLLFIKDVLATIQDNRSAVAAGGMELILKDVLFSKRDGMSSDHTITGFTDVLIGNNATSFAAAREFALIEARPPRCALMRSHQVYDQKDQLAFKLQAASQGRNTIVKGCLTDLFYINIMLMIPATTSSSFSASIIIISGISIRFLSNTMEYEK
jgi:hypothetical protein